MYPRFLYAASLFLLAFPVHAAEPATLRLPLDDTAAFVAFSPNGKLLASGSNDRAVTLWDLTSGKAVATLEGHDSLVSAAAFGPDGKTLASASSDRLVKLWDVASGKERAALQGHEGPVVAVAFSPDGKTLASASWDRTVKLWDLATGKERASLQGHEGPVYAVVFSGDGNTLATGSFDGTARIWNAASGKQKSLVPLGDIAFSVALSPDGEHLAAAIGKPSVKLMDAATARERAVLLGDDGPIFHVLFSEDGKTLTTAGAAKTVTLWETASARKRATLSGHSGKLSALALASDGRMLASGGHDHAVLIHDLSRLASQKQPTTVEELNALWADLYSEDAARAYRAMWDMNAVPAQSVPFLKQHVQPVPRAVQERITRLIADLDHDQFTKRQEAEKELERMEEQAGPALRKALQGRLPSLEVRRRMERIVQKLEGQALSPEYLRSIRAIEVLERLATPAAREVLEALTHGAPDVKLTLEAQRSLERLKRRAMVER